MQVEFDKADWQNNSDGTWLLLRCKNPQRPTQFLSEMKKNKPYIAELKEKRKDRSLNANNYFWVLCGKLAAILRLTPEEIYRQYIPNIGDNYAIVPIMDSAIDTWSTNWSRKGVGWVCESLGKSKLDGYTNVVCYYGSSVYDTRQMSRLIDMVVHDCKSQGIETMTPTELDALKARWSDAQTNKSA